MADEGAPSVGRVEAHIRLEVPLLARQPREHHHNPHFALLIPPVEPPSLPPHLARFPIADRRRDRRKSRRMGLTCAGREEREWRRIEDKEWEYANCAGRRAG